jgi:subtilisin
MKDRNQHHFLWFFSGIFSVTLVSLLLCATTSFAEPTIPQEVLDAITQKGTAQIIVELDVPWTPEGFLYSGAAVATQRTQIANTQIQFIETLNQDLVVDDIIDDAASPDGTPTISAETAFQTVPYLVMIVNSMTLSYVQQNAQTNNMVLDVSDEPSLQESLPLIGADKAWEQNYSGQGQGIAIIDTGVDKAHSFFSPNRVIAEACFSKTLCPNGKTTQESEGAGIPCDFDNCDHGTHVAGIAARVAKEAKIIAIQVFSDFGGIARTVRSDQIKALEWLYLKRDAFDTPLAAVNMSLEDKKEHTTSCNDDVRAKIIQNLHSVGIATIASSGNQGYINGISAPACIPEVISVGAIDKSGSIWTQTNRTNLLNLLAPGVGIESALPGGLMGVKDGTSMAAPHVAGAWAILKAANSEASIDNILTRLTETGQAINGMPLIQIDAALPQTYCDVIQEGLVAHYSFEENAQDVTGNGNDGTESNVHYIKGQCGKALQLTGNTDNDASSFVVIGDKLDAMDNSITISARIKTADFNQNHALIVAKGMASTGNSPETGYAIGYSSEEGVLYFGLTDDNLTSLKASIPITQLATNEFILVTGTLERRSFFSTLRLYINGGLVSVQRGDIGFANTDISLAIGANYRAPEVQNTMGFNGIIDDVLFYNRALSELEVSTLYNPEVPDSSQLPSEYAFKVNKMGEGRGKILAKLISETDWSLRCDLNCQEASYNYAPNSKVLLRAAPDKGFVFNSWSGSCRGMASKITVTMDVAKICTAQFDLDPNKVMYSLTINKVGNGSVKSSYPAGIDCGTHCTAYYQPNQNVNLEILFDDSDTLFTGWTGDCDGIKPNMRVAMDAAKTCTATFQAYNPAEKFALTVNKIGNLQGIIRGNITGESTTISCRAGCPEANYQYTSGSKVVLTAIAPTGFIFTGWNGDCNGTESQITVLIDSAKNCSANFARDEVVEMYKLEIILSGTGEGIVTQGSLINCGDICSTYYLKDETVRLAVKTAPLSAFLGWGGDCDKNKVVMTQDMHCTVNFQSELEQIAEEMADAFYTGARLENNDPIATEYPRTADNETRLKEAFWLNISTLMQTDQHLAGSTTQIWPTQFEGIEWLPPDTKAEYTRSIQIKADEFVGIRIKLLNSEGVEEEVGIVVYYSDELPTVDDGGGWTDITVAFFSRWAFRQWW